MPGKVILEVSQGPIRGQVFQFQEHDTFIFGRSRDCHARLSQDDTTASRHHFILEVNPPEVCLRDLGSLNGTYVNGKKFGGRKQNETPEEAARRVPLVYLKDKDEIGVGETIFTVRIIQPALCCECGIEIPDSFRSISRWTEENFICPQCRERMSMSVDRIRKKPEIVTCSQCGGDISNTSERADEYICDKCGSEAEFDPVQTVVKMLVDQAVHAHGEASLSDIAGYVIESLIGCGPMGAVYLAQRKSDGANVALKIITSRVAVDERSRQRFHRDMDKIKDLEHPNIVRLLDHGSAGSSFFFSMEFCGGGSLNDLIHHAGGTLPLQDAGRILLQCLDALSYAHSHGVVHRSLKPENILFLNDSMVAKLSEFSFSRTFERAGFSGMTATFTPLGVNPVFMARELLTSFKSASPVSDIWSIGAIFYFMLTGQSPRDFPAGCDPIEVVLRGGFVPVRKRNPDIPKKIAELIECALSDNISHRFASAMEFRQNLAKVL